MLAHEAWGLLASSLVPEHPPDLAFIFRLLNIALGSPESREVYRRLLQIRQIRQEYEARKGGMSPEALPPATDGDGG